MANLLVVVDYQNDFVSGALDFEQARALEGPIAARVDQALAAGWRVIFTRDTHGPDYLETREGRFLPVPHCLKGSAGWHLYGSLAAYESAADPRVAFVDKPTFGSAELAGAAEALCGGEPPVIQLCGVVTSICVVSNAILLHSRFLSSEIAVLQNLCAAADPADHQNALRLLAGMGYLLQ
ncbi:cysteine hydrolase family protein [Allofournierella sp.]|uniref:cysteine hydrolase family protein n=1 Tax=Allofournierella sp. TaxID=1940256 RepID=UPI003AB7E305